MDFDNFTACNPTGLSCLDSRPPTQIHGQGDFKRNPEGNRNEYMYPDNTRKFRTQIVRETNEPEVNTERQKNIEDGGQCHCVKKQKDKPKHDSKQEKDYGNFEKANYFWDSSPPQQRSTRTKNEKIFTDEQPKFSYNSNTDTLLMENIIEFEEKVDFLFRIFKDQGQKFHNDDYAQHLQTNTTAGILQDISRLFHFNKRLCAAEEGIEKLALILEYLVKDCGKKKTEEYYSETVNFEELSFPQRINYLKNRNDLVLSLMSAFLKAGLTEEGCSKFQFSPLCKEPKLSSTNLGREKYQAKDLDRAKIMETLQKLRMQIAEVRQKKSQFFNEHHKPKSERKEEVEGKGGKYPKNKLEVISEQAEFALSDESDNAADDFGGKNAIEILERLSEINEESDESDLSVQDVTFKIVTQEAEFLKTPLDNLLFSKRDFPENKSNNGSHIQGACGSLQEGCKKVNEDYDSSSELSYLFYDAETPEKPKEKNKPSPIGGNRAKQKETKEASKRERNSSEKTTKDSSKGGKREECLESRESCRRTPPENMDAVFSARTSRKGCSVTDLTSPSREQRKWELRRKEKAQRPMTDSISHRKPLTGLKTPGQEKIVAPNPSINNVKSRNKILFSKKSCVETP